MIAALSGALLSLSLPPAGIGPVAFVAIIPFLWIVRDSRPRRGALLGLVFGFAYFGAVLYWILLFGKLGWFALTIASAAFLALFGMLAPVVWRWRRPLVSAIGLAALWTGIEWLRSMWPLGGFTWGGVGYSQADDRFLLPLASWTGVWGIAFVVVLVNGLIMVAIERGRREPRRAVAPILLGLALVLAPSLIRIPEPDGPRLDVAAIQVDVLRARGLPSAAEDLAVARMNAELYGRLADHPPDLGVWGEGALDPGAFADPATRTAVGDAIRRVGAPAVIGAVTDGPGGTQRTETLLYDGGGRLVDRYSKVHLVPFGEYVPWRRYLGWISALEQIPVDRTPGANVRTLQADDLPAFGTPICFENSFPVIDREMVQRGAGFLVVTTNNASYGYSAASRQHLIMSRLRAVENGRWVVHAAISGISAFIDPTGRVVAQAGLFEPRILRHDIVASRAETLYTRLGDWFPVACLLLSFGLAVTPRGRRRAVRAPTPLPERPRTLVILPTYNERETIEQVAGGVLALPEQVDVVVIDDGSPDGTNEAVRAMGEWGKRLRLVERPSKAGLASAYLVGFRMAIDEAYDLVVEMDSDLSHQPRELSGLLGAAHDHDLVIGSRYVPGGSVTNWSRARLALSKAGNVYARLALGFPLHDATSGFRVYRRAALERIIAEPITSDGYGFQIELALRAWSRGYTVGESPITFRERQHGHSKISRRIVFEALWLVTVWGIRERVSPPGVPLP